VTGGLIAAIWLALAAPAAGQPCADLANHRSDVVLELAAPGGGAVFDFEVVLRTGGQEVTGFSHLVPFLPGIRIADDNGIPRCYGYDLPSNGQAHFTLEPPGCLGDCDGLRAEVSAGEPFFDGALAYYCELVVEAWVAVGTYRLRGIEIATVGPQGEVLESSGRDALVTVVPPGWPTPTLTAPPTRTPTPPPHDVFLHVGSATGRVGDPLSFDVRFDAGGCAVAGTLNDLTFDPAAPIAALPNGRPSCTVNPEIGKPASAFVFLPPGCSMPECRGVRALVISLNKVAPIPDGSVLYTCRIDTRRALPGPFPLVAGNVSASTPDGQPIEAGASDGRITLLPSASGRRVARAGSYDHGCAMTAPAAGAAAPMLLLPVLAMLARWRRAAS
jgi:hypothetical protein